MNGNLGVWLEFAACAGVIGIAGARLVRYGDALAALSGMSRSWIGMILMATVTSLPELVTGLSAVTVASNPDIAVGDALGSTVFNLALLALAEPVLRTGGLYSAASRSHLFTAAAGVVMLGLVLLALGAVQFAPGWAIGHVSLFSVVLMAVYGLAMAALYRIERRSMPERAPGAAGMSLRKALGGYALAAMFIVVAGIWLPLVGVQLARLMGWSDSFVGTLFVALATSMPELATTLAALRIGAVDLALGNILGSNLFDLLIIAIDDVAYLKGPLFRDLSSAHVATGLIAAVMSSVVCVALLRPPRPRLSAALSWAGLSLLGLYLLNVSAQYLHRP
ncbi:sodium:calcium antiporter [Rhizobacter sp. AJA081-3]|uniref:sodium:calcium antiporter n=1 Tax=Rhizobacter sp. AJA081-3 TaxID=2753607 RepID=UPI001ADEE11F|nr:sodium:calcium antiporter [Rhizobacter sp. AJA081-3]QTN21751.1 sodium:calcium antiporter [Rhizobacter sp. AJA081-3]